MLFGLHNSAYFSMQDGIGVSLCEKENKIYSKTRMFGSIGYCVALIFGSYLVEILNYPIIFLIAGIFFFFINVVALFIKTPDEEENKSEEPVEYKELFKNIKFIIYCIFYLLLNGIWVIGESYVSTYFNYLEVKDSTYSLMFGLGVGVEILTIYIFSKLIKKNMNLKLILIFSCLIISGRYLIMGTDLSPSILIIITSLLRGIGWGGFLSSHLLLVKKLLGLNLTTKGITFLAIITNLLGSIGNFLIPYIYTNFSFTSVYLFFGFIQIIATIILSRINFNLSRKEKL
jgi:PPP family 3-phenylpropionic acid transporter